MKKIVETVTDFVHKLSLDGIPPADYPIEPLERSRHAKMAPIGEGPRLEPDWVETRAAPVEQIELAV